ncbi:MAG TPA: hypothetical protein VND93_31800 [Myxococcales bacterium]|jgi:hypothetical protein|nr:hypothetical protein [Myxococcales bacterium]
MTAKHMLAVGAVIAFALGLFMVLATQQFLEPLGLATDPKVALLGQAQGVLLLSIGLTSWMVSSADWNGMRAVLAGNLLAQVLSIIINLRGYMTGIVPQAVVGQVGLHVLLGAGYAFFLLRKPANAVTG